MASTNVFRKRKRKRKPGYDRPFDGNKIAWFLLALLVLFVLVVRHFNW